MLKPPGTVCSVFSEEFKSITEESHEAVTDVKNFHRDDNNDSRYNPTSVLTGSHRPFELKYSNDVFALC